MSQSFKQDINFLEYPLWMQDNREKEGFASKDREGFVYSTAYVPPSKTDMIFLYYILLKSQQNDWSRDIELTQYEFLKNCGISPGKYWRDRLKDSLKRWCAIMIEFQGTFYDGHNYKAMCFHILDSWKIREDNNKLHIKISGEWLVQVKESNFFKYLNFEQVKALRSPLALRLYELLVKAFQGRAEWKVGALNLAKKIPMKEKYAAHIIPKIEVAVGRINKNTDFRLELKVERPERGKAVFVFRKLPEKGEAGKSGNKVEKKEAPKSINPVSLEREENESVAGLEELMLLLPQKHQEKKSCRKVLLYALRKYELGYIESSILYANKEARKNYSTFLRKTLEEDWGAELREEREEKRRQKEAQRRRDEEERRESERQRRIQEEVSARLKRLTAEEVEALREEALALLKLSGALPEELGESAIRLHMRMLLTQRLFSQKQRHQQAPTQRDLEEKQEDKESQPSGSEEEAKSKRTSKETSLESGKSILAGLGLLLQEGGESQGE